MTKVAFSSKNAKNADKEQEQRKTSGSTCILILLVITASIVLVLFTLNIYVYISLSDYYNKHNQDNDPPVSTPKNIKSVSAFRWLSFYTEKTYFKDNSTGTFNHLLRQILLKFSDGSSTQRDVFTDSINSSPQCDVQSDVYKFDCWPEFYNATKEKCTARGCCWNLPKTSGVPDCYYPKNYAGYHVTKKSRESFGISALLSRSTNSPWPNDIMQLKMDLKFETPSRLHIKIYDPKKQRYEVPISTPKVEHASADLQYSVLVNNDSTLIVQRTEGNKQIIFNSERMAPLIYADQVLQMSTILSSSYLYGLGEHRGPFLQSVNWRKLAFWARDQPPQLNANLYGDHPFYMNIEADGKAHGLFLLNSNAMEVDLQPTPAITFRTIGGILDFYIFTGPTPDLVVNQYLDVIGRPFMPPYWALGFHLCRWGYGGSAGLKKVIKRMREAKIPYDTQWSDIDYMDNHLDWTYSKETYSDLPDIVKDLHDHGQHYIPIVDPGISNTQKPGTYPPYDEGLQDNVFVMIKNGSSPIIGKVWPGNTVFPDFFHPNATDYWYRMAKVYHSKVPFDGLWTDMNEPSNEVSGSITGCPNNKLNNPPLLPPSLTGNKLQDRTICPSAKQYLSSHYNLHSLYGYSETKVTMGVLRKLRQKRSIVISRSTFPGTGTHGGHWLGDNNARWEDLYYSIPGILNFNMFGIPLVGADICGFSGNTTAELCTRWTQLGVFYPFMRNHNSIGDKDQDPASFDTATQDAMRKALQLRYTMIPYLYTQFFRVHKMNQSSIAKPLFYRYGKSDNVIYTIDKQFMWGNELLIVPVLTQGATTVDAYIPQDIWYDGYNYSRIAPVGQYVTLDAPIDKINYFIRGGSVLLQQPFENTTTTSRQKNFHLIVACNMSASAFGDFYWDDGEMLDSIEKGLYNYMEINLTFSRVESTVIHANYHPPNGMILETLLVVGIEGEPQLVQVNGGPWSSFTYNTTNEMICCGGDIPGERPALVQNERLANKAKKVIY